MGLRYRNIRARSLTAFYINYRELFLSLVSMATYPGNINEAEKAPCQATATTEKPDIAENFQQESAILPDKLKVN